MLSETMETEQIQIFKTHSSFLIWDSEGAHKLRTKLRIVGKLIGCLPGLPRQNEQLGLPLQLMAEEAKLLIEKRIGRLMDGIGTLEKPKADEVEHFKSRRKKLYDEQIGIAREKRKQEILQHREKIIEGKKAKLRKKLQRLKDDGEEVDEVQLADPHVRFNVDEVQIPPLPEKHQLIQLPISTPQERLACKEVSWLYPSSREEHVRYKVFEHLWQEGYYLTSGSKFGGDFLVYPGDPARYHSFFIAVCLQEDQTLTAVELASFSRMGTSVKKTILLCSLHPSGKVRCVSLEWSGIS